MRSRQLFQQQQQQLRVTYDVTRGDAGTSHDYSLARRKGSS